MIQIVAYFLKLDEDIFLGKAWSRSFIFPKGREKQTTQNKNRVISTIGYAYVLGKSKKGN